tara:strand:+ start:5604 stop:6563 length:960 start_codon:yes stop_codon:yes gene_type:complete
MKKICLIGAGNWGKNYLPILYKRKSLFGIVESNLDTVNSLKIKYPQTKFYHDINKVSLEEYDGYIIATPANTHFEIAKKILNAKKSVLVEKPMTSSYEDSKILYELSIEKKTNLMVGHVLLFHPAFIKIKELITNGKLGDLQYIYSNRLNLGKIRNHENVFWSFAPHDIALFQFIINKNPKKILSDGISHLQSGIHDSTITLIKYPNKIMGHIFVSWLHPFKEHRFVVVGNKGMISFEDSKDKKPLLFYDKSIEWKGDIPIPKDGKTTEIKYDQTKPLDNQVDYFLNHLYKNKITKSDAKSGLKVMEILHKSTYQLNKD